MVQVRIDFREALAPLASFAIGSGCAKPDWIEQTLVKDAAREVDHKIRTVLVIQNAVLGGEAREAVETFLKIANTAMHKSKLHLVLT